MQKREKSLSKKQENGISNHKEKMTNKTKKGDKMATKKRTKNQKIAAAVKSLVVWSEMKVIAMKEGRMEDFKMDSEAVIDAEQLLLEMGIDVRPPSRKEEKEV